jgi:hypothetical protein
LSISPGGTATFSKDIINLSSVTNSGNLSFTSQSGQVSIDRLGGGPAGSTSFSSDTNVRILSSLGTTQVSKGSLMFKTRLAPSVRC